MSECAPISHRYGQRPVSQMIQDLLEFITEPNRSTHTYIFLSGFVTSYLLFAPSTQLLQVHSPHPPFLLDLRI